MNLGEAFREASRRIGRDAKAVEKYIAQSDLESVAQSGMRWTAVEVRPGMEEKSIRTIIKFWKSLEQHPGSAAEIWNWADNIISEQNKRS